MTCIIIDDEPLAREELDFMIREVGGLDVLGLFPNAIKATDFLKEKQVDIIFLDIEMPILSGLDFAAQIDKETLIIFTTAYPYYALKSYELDAIDYLLKPIDKLRLSKAMHKAIHYKELLSDSVKLMQVDATHSEFIWIKSERTNHKIFLKDILFIEALKDYVILHTSEQRLITAMNLKTIHQKISNEKLIRVSKSFVVNLSHISSFNNQFVFIGKQEIPLGEVYRKNFIKSYQNLLNDGNIVF